MLIGKASIAVPLNPNAISILRKQLFKHSEFVFTYKGAPIKQCNTKARRKALKRADIENRWTTYVILGHLGMYRMGLHYMRYRKWGDGHHWIW